MAQIASESGIIVDSEGKFIEMDSLMIVNFIVGMEDEFSISFPDEIFELEDLFSVSKFTVIITELLNENKNNEKLR